jgi:cytoskeleton protein RodZ
MTEPVGAELKRVREEQGLTISEVAHHLKLAPRQVEALEDERFAQLPGITFVRGMLKNYARLLKLAPEPLLERIAGRFEAPDASRLAERYSQPVPFSDGARHSTFVYLGLSIVVLSLGGGVAYQWYREHNAPTELVHAEPAPAAPRAQVKVIELVVHSELTAQVVVAPEAEKPAPPEKPALAEPPAVEKATVAKVVARGGVNRLIIRCEEDAWIEVKDANDRMLVSSLNPKGSERVVRARGPLSLVIGNARHVQVIHNDKPLDLAPHTKLTIARFTVP